MEAKRAYMCRERIVDLEFKISRLGILGKAYYDLAQIKLRRHRNQISVSRTQNMLLHAALDTLRDKARIARKNLGDLESLRKTVASLRVTYDHQMQLVFSRQRKLEAQITDTHSSELDCAGVLDPNTPDLIRIRNLEAQLTMIRLKTKDVQILMRHYEACLKPMKEEHTSYGVKLESEQIILNMKIAECEKLINSHHDAIRARDAAKEELEELIGQLFGKRGKGMVSPELEAKILAAIKEIKMVMNVGSMREMYHQFILQEKQSSYLQSIYVELKRTVDQLKNDYPPRRRSTMQPHAVASMIEGTKSLVRRQSSRRGSITLLQILEGTQTLVERLHEGNLTLTDKKSVEKEVLEQCQQRLVKLVQALNRRLKHIQRENVRNLEHEAKEASRLAQREIQKIELAAAQEARKTEREKRDAEIKSEMEAAEAFRNAMEAEREAKKEQRKAEIRAEIMEARATSKEERESEETVAEETDELKGLRTPHVVAVTVAEPASHSAVEMESEDSFLASQDEGQLEGKGDKGSRTEPCSTSEDITQTGIPVSSVEASTVEPQMASTILQITSPENIGQTETQTSGAEVPAISAPISQIDGVASLPEISSPGGATPQRDTAASEKAAQASLDNLSWTGEEAHAPEIPSISAPLASEQTPQTGSELKTEEASPAQLSFHHPPQTGEAAHKAEVPSTSTTLASEQVLQTGTDVKTEEAPPMHSSSVLECPQPTSTGISEAEAKSPDGYDSQKGTEVSRVEGSDLKGEQISITESPSSSHHPQQTTTEINETQPHSSSGHEQQTWAEKKEAEFTPVEGPPTVELATQARELEATPLQTPSTSEQSAENLGDLERIIAKEVAPLSSEHHEGELKSEAGKVQDIVPQVDQSSVEVASNREIEAGSSDSIAIALPSDTVVVDTRAELEIPTQSSGEPK